MKPTIRHFGRAAVNILHKRLLLSLLLASLATTVVYPFRSYLVVLPFFSGKLLEYSEEEAQKTAAYLTPQIMAIENGNLRLLPEIEGKVAKTSADLGLEKVKIFGKDGMILFSTDKSEIGSRNTQEYFHFIVAKGSPFSKIVSKNQQTLEGKTTVKDVAEIYVPVMRDLAFLGAFELYYDLTKRKNEINALLAREGLVSAFISFLMLFLVCFMLFHVSRASLEQEEAEEQLRRINADLENIVAEKTKELRVTQEASIHSLAILAESYDSTTGEHINRIRKITHLLAIFLSRDSSYSRYLQGKKEYIDDLALASILHDIGKTSIPKEVLAKPGKLSPQEFEMIKSHTSVAGDVLKRGNQLFVDQFAKDSYLALACDIAMHHHEKWDGTGYPDRLCEQHIPLSARIVAIADVYDALRSERPYKDAWTHEKAMELIASEAGKHFDPEIVRVFSLHDEEFRAIFDA